ncbi:MAG TPA: CPBP family glutamic-type intramembrane protease [Candidatus Woesebacteria bacterium]|nr:CPBP family glutamic-type intramembrane protease [Candidatus Woesebacteria bacterium]
MPSKNNANLEPQSQLVFLALVVLSFLFWVLYRFIFNFPVFFDELFGKAIFFGIPILIYASATKKHDIAEAMSPSKLFPGLLRGLAFGGLLGFFSLILLSLRSSIALLSIPVFMTDWFWSEFLLALMTAFFESIFFFGFIQTTLATFWGKSELVKTVLTTASIFLIFHLPNIAMRFAGIQAIAMVGLLFCFGLGQALLFVKEKNIYPLIITHAIWGMILLIHF